jgi:hypothetical protein
LQPSGQPSDAPSHPPTNPPQTPPPTSPPQTPPPTPVPTPVPTPTPVQTATPSPSITPFAYKDIWDIAGEGATPRPYNGNPALDNQFRTSNADLDTQKGDYDGDLMPNDPGAKPGGGGQGPVGNTIDTISCDTTMSNNYHVHAFIGLFVNGQQIVVPDAIGIYHAGGDQVDSDGWPNQEVYGFCFYHIHTHDSSGLIHVEDPNPLNLTFNDTLYNLGPMFDIWGIQVSAMQFGPFMGPVTAYTSGQFSRAHQCFNGTSCYHVGSNMYSQWNGDPAQIPLYSHEVIWIEVGTGNPPADQLPGVSFAVAQ